MKELKNMCEVQAPSGDESKMTQYLLNYINKNINNWSYKPKIYEGKGFQDNLILVFGKPKTAIFAHIDSIGFTVKYNNEIIKIGGPIIEEGTILVGEDSIGKIEGRLVKKENKIFINYKRVIERGTSLTFKVNFRNTKDYIQ